MFKVSSGLAKDGFEMAWPVSLQVALKEWAIVCEALDSGTQIILLRKGGIHDVGGEFELAHRHFLLFPTYLHQNAAMLKPERQSGIEPCASEPEQVKIHSAGIVTDIIQLDNRARMDAIESHHVWASPLVDMRFNYRPENPLYLLLVRAYRLHAPVFLRNTPAYAGCKSWVPLEHPVDLGEAHPVLDDARYAHHRDEILMKLRRV
jgi:hypothetical protein